MKSVKAFAPGNISCVFYIYGNGLKKASLGIGFTVDKGVEVKISEFRKNIVYYNKKKMDFPTVISVIRKLTSKKVKVEIKSDLHMGTGFGISGAAALATAYAINKLFGLGKEDIELAKIAHYSEVENSTGLGDVSNQFHGGFLMKTIVGKPFSVEKIDIDKENIYYKVFSRVDTKKVINSSVAKKRINKAGLESINEIKNMKKYSLSEIIKISNNFALESGLRRNKKVIKTIKDIEAKGGTASMIMLGNAVFSDTPFKGATKLQIIQKGAYVE